MDLLKNKCISLNLEDQKSSGYHRLKLDMWRRCALQVLNSKQDHNNGCSKYVTKENDKLSSFTPKKGEYISYNDIFKSILKK